jgi:hypothetical protein
MDFQLGTLTLKRHNVKPLAYAPDEKAAGRRSGRSRKNGKMKVDAQSGEKEKRGKKIFQFMACFR